MHTVKNEYCICLKLGVIASILLILLDTTVLASNVFKKLDMPKNVSSKAYKVVREITTRLDSPALQKYDYSQL